MLTLTVILLFIGEVALFDTPYEIQPQFKLYTRLHPTKPVHLTEKAAYLESTDFNSTVNTVIIVHGFTESHDSVNVQTIRDAYLQASNLNVIAMDWWVLARGPQYDAAAENTKQAARSLATFIDSLMLTTKGAARQGLHVVGFSLGAQVAGLAAANLTTGLLPRITALDPAKPIFEIKSKDERLDSSDAEFVQVIHTASGFLSFMDPVGHADFYPNGGKSPQPGCVGEEALVCSHHMACKYFAESVQYPMSFSATSCDTWNNYKRGKCGGNKEVYMGAFSSTSARGTFYLKTNAESPFGQGKNDKSSGTADHNHHNCDHSNMMEGHLCPDGSTSNSTNHEPEPTKDEQDTSLSAVSIILISGSVILALFLIVCISFRYIPTLERACGKAHTIIT